MKTSLKFGMLHTVYTAEEEIENVTETVEEDGEMVERVSQVSKRLPVHCRDEKCGRLVQHDDVCFIDTLSDEGDVYCDSCGKCLRYARKMAKRREELGQTQ